MPFSSFSLHHQTSPAITVTKMHNSQYNSAFIFQGSLLPAPTIQGRAYFLLNRNFSLFLYPLAVSPLPVSALSLFPRLHGLTYLQPVSYLRHFSSSPPAPRLQTSSGFLRPFLFHLIHLEALFGAQFEPLFNHSLVSDCLDLERY